MGRAAALLAVGALVLVAGPAGAAARAPGMTGKAGAAAAPRAVPPGTVPPGATSAGSACRSGSHPRLAARMSAQIAAVLRARVSAAAVAVSDPATGVTCELSASRRFDSASIVKATILAALLHRDGAPPSAGERAHAAAMITESDNDAATDLWHDVGPVAMRQFLNRAQMTQTVPGAGGYWGLTQVTAHDQMKLLHLLTAPNAVLSPAARSYELALMARVDPAQRWGISAGAPAGMTVDLKNGWLPTGAAGWLINSIGCVSRSAAQRQYCLVVLTDGNPTMAYGVQTISAVARVVNTELNSPLATAVAGAPPASRPPTAPSPSAASSAKALADSLAPTGPTPAPVRPASLGPLGLRAPAAPAPPARPANAGMLGTLGRPWTAIAAGVITLALLAARARLRARRARRAQPGEAG